MGLWWHRYWDCESDINFWMWNQNIIDFCRSKSTPGVKSCQGSLIFMTIIMHCMHTSILFVLCYYLIIIENSKDKYCAQTCDVTKFEVGWHSAYRGWRWCGVRYRRNDCQRFTKQSLQFWLVKARWTSLFVKVHEAIIARVDKPDSLMSDCDSSQSGSGANQNFIFIASCVCMRM